MKTAMQELYSEIEKFKGITDTVSITDIQRMIGNYYIEKEKQQILTANNRGYKVGRKDMAETANDYYEDTFGDNHEAGI